ncbi:hypothetical protein Tsp_14372, partial [Trichinella spiralis]|uniref:hypothetical protein n=1 Tax=Trichinella spiralis TaxID=6334 RepID=UPI0001EFEB91
MTSITLTSSEFDVSSDGPLSEVDAVTFIIGTSVISLIIRQTTLRQSSSAGARIDLSSVRFQCDMTKIKSWHIYIEFIKSSRERKVLIRSIKVSRVEADTNVIAY